MRRLTIILTSGVLAFTLTWLGLNQPVFAGAGDPVRPTNLSATNLIYNGAEQTVAITNFNTDTMAFASDSVHEATNAGSYIAKVVSKTGQWADDTTEAVVVNWQIDKQSITVFKTDTYSIPKPVEGETLPSVSITPQSGEPYVFSEFQWVIKGSSGLFSDVASSDLALAGRYYAVEMRVKVTDTENYKLAPSIKIGGYAVINGKFWFISNSVSAIEQSFPVRSETIAAVSSHPNKPTLGCQPTIGDGNCNLVYNGIDQNSPVGIDPSSNSYLITGDRAKNSGIYTYVVTSATGKWSDGTADPISKTWTIQKADPNYTVPTGLEGMAGARLSSVTLPTGFTWKYPDAVLSGSTYSSEVIYTPVDTANYNVATTTVQVTVTPSDYTFLAGANQIYEIGTNNSAIFIVDADVSLFTKAFVNDSELASEHYVVESGSTKITLQQAYLDNLADGTYDLRTEFSDGRVALTQFTIRRGVPTSAPTGTESATNVAVPATGVQDGNFAHLASAILLIILGLVGCKFAKN